MTAAALNGSHFIPVRFSRSVRFLHMASVGPDPMSQPRARGTRQPFGPFAPRDGLPSRTAQRPVPAPGGVDPVLGGALTRTRATTYRLGCRTSLLWAVARCGTVLPNFRPPGACVFSLPSFPVVLVRLTYAAEQEKGRGSARSRARSIRPAYGRPRICHPLGDAPAG